MFCGHVKLYIYLLKTYTKNNTHQNMLCFRLDYVIASKTTKVKILNSNTKTLQNFVEIKVHAIFPPISQDMIL